MKYEGKFTRLPGLVYDFKEENGASCFVDLPAEGLPEAAYYVGSIDWGGTDPTACLVALMDTKDCLWVFWEHYKAKEDILQTLKTVDEWHKAFRKQTGSAVRTWWCDHRPENIRALRSLGLMARPAKKGPNSIAVGISLVQARLRTGRLKIIKPQDGKKVGCSALLAEGLLYRYPTEDGEAVSNKPIDKDNHAMDSLRMMIAGIDRKQAAKQLRQTDYIDL